MNDNTRSASVKAWAAMCAATLAVVLAAFVVFGLFGGFMLVVGLNGFTERQALPIFLVYIALVSGGAALVAATFNLLIIRRGFPAARVPSWAALLTAVVPSALALAVPGLVFVFG